MSILPKAICRIKAISIKFLMGFVAKIGKNMLKFIWKLEGPEITKAILRKKKTGCLTLPDFKTYYKATDLVCSKCYNKIPQTLWLKQWKFISHNSGGEEIPDQCARHSVPVESSLCG